MHRPRFLLSNLPNLRSSCNREKHCGNTVFGVTSLSSFPTFPTTSAAGGRNFVSRPAGVIKARQRKISRLRERVKGPRYTGGRRYQQRAFSFSVSRGSRNGTAQVKRRLAERARGARTFLTYFSLPFLPPCPVVRRRREKRKEAPEEAINFERHY